MKLEIFDKYTRYRVGMIKIYDYVTYNDKFRGMGTFEIRIPTTEESLQYITDGNYIWFEDKTFGIIKGIKDVEGEDTQISVYGYLLNYLLTIRSNLLSYKKYDTVGNVARDMFDKLFISSSDSRRNINFLSISDNRDDNVKFPGKRTFQNTGDTFLDCISDFFQFYGLGFELIPILDDTGENPNISGMEFKIITPRDRTFGNNENAYPIVFSFDLNNLNSMEFEEDNRDYKSVAFVASEGQSEERYNIEVGDTTSSGLDRIELYVDARDIQTDSDPENPLTQEELIELMQERGEEKLSECVKIITFEASLNLYDTKYKYGADFKKGDYVSVIDKRTGRKFDLQIFDVTKTISQGEEHLDVSFGMTRMDILNKKERRLYNV